LFSFSFVVYNDLFDMLKDFSIGVESGGDGAEFGEEVYGAVEEAEEVCFVD